MNRNYVIRMDKFNNINGYSVFAVQWDGTKEHGARIAAVIDMDVRYDLTDGKLTMHIGGYDNMVANEFDFVGIGPDGVLVASYNDFMQSHDMVPDQPFKNIGFAEVVKPLMEWLSKNKNPHITAIVTGNVAELVEGVQNVRTNEFIVD